eukprot:PRCOL_00002205-RA
MATAADAPVAYLEADVGQCEFTPAGLIALHVLRGGSPLTGPPHAHLRAWRRAAFYGDTSPKADARALPAAVAMLAAEARTQLAGVPLVVNTCGWVTGAGLDILSDTLRGVAPTHLVSLCPTGGRAVLPRGAFWLEEDSSDGVRASATCRVLDLPALPAPAVGAGGSWQAADARAAAALAYFHAPMAHVDDAGMPAASMGAATALAEAVPYAAPRAALGVVFLHAEVPPEHEATVLNGALVGLARPWQGTEGVHAYAHGWPKYECLALGVVKAYDPAHGGVVYVHTPAPPETLATATVLLHGRVELPASAYTPPGMRAAYVLPHAISTEGVGAAPQKARNNLQRGGGGAGAAQQQPDAI